MPLKLNILCQSPVFEGQPQAAAIQQTVQLARLADRLGYGRFWVAEHHSDRALASGAPEVLIAHLASVTERIRVGAGGVLLPHHAPYHVAEQFNLLQSLFPGRVDLGLGRSAGQEAQAARALRSRVGAVDGFALIDELLTWLGQGNARRPFLDTFAAPRVDTTPEIWVLGTSPASARYAADRGLRYSLGGFLDPRQVLPCLSTYFQHFQPSARLSRPYVNLGWYVQCAPTESEARRWSRSSECWFVNSFIRGKNAAFPLASSAKKERFNPMEEMALAFRREHSLVGTASQVLSGLNTMAKQWRIDEFTLVTIAEPEQRRRSYELIAEQNERGADLTPY